MIDNMQPEEVLKPFCNKLKEVFSPEVAKRLCTVSSTVTEPRQMPIQVFDPNVDLSSLIPNDGNEVWDVREFTTRLFGGPWSRLEPALRGSRSPQKPVYLRNGRASASSESREVSSTLLAYTHVYVYIYIHICSPFDLPFVELGHGAYPMDRPPERTSVSLEQGWAS